ncbi:putative arginyl-tRNA synthetase [Streptantibioticus cattleyicolor NRRL 8057 = DSM 46488]|nr:putative arginyl-tRNA synthetase [Streptantibioticus cattleyicolor NRRL 8057 = DSM 46488]
MAAGELGVEVPERVLVERPRGPRQGDYATSVALRLAGAAGRPAREVAGILAGRLVGEPGIARVDVAGPGFLNITLESRAHAGLVDRIRDRRHEYGRTAHPRAFPVPPTTTCDARPVVLAEVCERLVRGARPVPVRPAGVAYRELLDRLGPDATHWALLRPPAQDVPCLAAEALLAQREANPLFRVRYAHARSRALLRNGRDLGVDPDRTAQAMTESGAGDGDGGHPSATGSALLAHLADHPRIVAAAARDRAPDRVARHLERTADAFFRWYDTCPALPRGDEKPSAVHEARLRLADAAGIVLADGLHLLGISAPDHL